MHIENIKFLLMNLIFTDVFRRRLERSTCSNAILAFSELLLSSVLKLILYLNLIDNFC
jgi:hypothetical protein